MADESSNRSSNFITQIIDEDLKSGKYSLVMDIWQL